MGVTVGVDVGGTKIVAGVPRAGRPVARQGGPRHPGPGLGTRAGRGG